MTEPIAENVQILLHQVHGMIFQESRPRVRGRLEYAFLSRSKVVVIFSLLNEDGYAREQFDRFQCGRDAYAKCRWSECQTALPQSRQAVTPASSRGTSGCPSRDCLSEASHWHGGDCIGDGQYPTESNLPNVGSESSCPRCRSAFQHSTPTVQRDSSGACPCPQSST